ncbi:MAG: hypothetical protein WA160_15840 [Pseudobdellovibrio sp.]
MSIFEIFLFITCSVLSIYLFSHRKALRNVKQKNTHIYGLLTVSNKKLAELQSTVEELSKYKHILNVELYVEEKKRQSEVQTSDASMAAKDILIKANTESIRVKLVADNYSTEKVQTAEAEAKKIAGSAMDALKNSERYEKTAQAMKNIIEGYGDKYIIPTHKYGIASADAMILNMFLSSSIPLLITADLEMAHCVLSENRFDKIVFLPDSLAYSNLD